MTTALAAAGPHADEAAPAVPALRLVCWGTRGSIPSPGPATARFGGNTPCVEVRTADDKCLIFDAGTGIRLLGRHLLERSAPLHAHLFLTHFHWDHIQGIPFFAPLYDPRATLHIHGAKQGDTDIQTLFAGQMGPIYFPIPFEAVAARLTFEHLNGEPWVEGDVEVAAMRVRHPAHTYAYRIRVGRSSVAYVPDNELVGGSYPVGGDGWRADLVRFLDGVDVLLHDAMFTEAEYPAREGWGHSTFEQATRLAETAGVRRLFFFHHAPERTDPELLRILEAARADLERRGSTLELHVAAEGEELSVQEDLP